MAGPTRTRPPARLPYTFAIDDTRYTLPARPARWWLNSIALESPGGWWQIIPGGLTGEEPGRLLGRMLDPDDPFDLDDAEEVAAKVIEAIVGVNFWAAQRLARMAYGNWLSFDAWLVTRGQGDLLEGHPARLCSAVYAWRLAACEKKSDFSKLDTDVFAPPPSRTASGRPRDPAAARGWDEQTESDVFAAAMAQMGKTV